MKQCNEEINLLLKENSNVPDLTQTRILAITIFDFSGKEKCFML
jgi:hypothetical protein